jgi:hypothetical protein
MDRFIPDNKPSTRMTGQGYKNQSELNRVVKQLIWTVINFEKNVGDDEINKEPALAREALERWIYLPVENQKLHLYDLVIGLRRTLSLLSKNPNKEYWEKFIKNLIENIDKQGWY